jgi:hypothetical protein
VRRLVLFMAVIAAWSGAGSALLTSPAAAGGVDDRGRLSAAIYNYTPYTWTLVTVQAGPPCPYNDPTGQNRCWAAAPPATVAPGAAPVFQLDPNDSESALFGTKFGYDAYFTYRVDVLGGGTPEYVTLAISQCECSGTYGTGHAAVQVFNTVAPPPAAYDPASLGPPGPQTVNAQLAAQPGPQAYDYTISAVGNFNVDASTDLGKPFVDLLNSACAGAASTSCSFTPTAPITYGPGPLGNRRLGNNCDLSAQTTSTKRSLGAADAPSSNDPNYIEIEYTAAQSASLSVGGGITATAEFSLFNTISSEASVSVEAEHEWEEVKTYTRKAKVFIPSNSWGFAWAAPTVGRVTGTLVAQVGAATYTANNFTEVRNGVTGTTDPLKQPTPAFNIVTATRPMTAAEKVKYCGADPSSGSRARRALKARTAGPPASLRVGLSVGRVALGETQEAVLARLGWPTVRRFELEPCQGMPGCTAIRGLHGTWIYKQRKLSVVFGPDRRVAALIHSGNQAKADRVGKDSTLAQVRGTFPDLACRTFGDRIDCTTTRRSGGRTTRTVFRLSDRLRGPGTRWKTNKVLIYVDGKVSA